MPSCTQYPHTVYINLMLRHDNPSVGKPNKERIRPRTSPATFSKFQDPGRGQMIAKSMSNPRKWATQKIQEKSRQPTNVDTEYLVISPGYTMTRSKSHIAVRLGEEFFGGPKVTNNAVDIKPPSAPRILVHDDMQDLKGSGEPGKPQQRDDFMEDLQEQISTLTAMIEQERKDHQDTQQKLSKQLEDQITELLKRNEEEIRSLKNRHAIEINILKEEGNARLEQEQAEAAKNYEGLRRDYSFLEGSFKTYKENLLEEVNENWLKKELKLKEMFEDQKMEELRRQKHELLNEFEEEKKVLKKREDEELTMLQQSNARQMDEAWKKYREVSQELKILQTSKELLQSDLAEKQNVIILLKKQIEQGQAEARKVKVQMENLGKGFDHRLNKAQAKQRHIIQSLMNENADLRRKLIAKSEQLFSEKTMEGFKTRTDHPVSSQYGL